MENYRLTVAQVTGRVAYIPPLLCARNVVMYTHHLNDTCVTLFAQAAVKLQPLTQCLVMFMPCSGRVPHYTSPLLLYIRCCTLPIYV